MLKINRRSLRGRQSLRSPCSPPCPPGAQGKNSSCSFVQNGNLTILDPIWTTAYVTRDHGYMIYDTLFSTDEKNEVKPQMVDKYEVSPDKTLWTFTLRDGLEWHDGKPVTAEDCVVLDQALGGARLDGPEADGVRRRGEAGRRQDLHHQAQGAVRPGARFARQAVVQRAVHDAQGASPTPIRSSRSTARSAPARSSTRRTSPSPARGTSTSRTPSTSRGRSPPRAWPAARSPRSTASSSSTCPTRRSR